MKKLAKFQEKFENSKLLYAYIYNNSKKNNKEVVNRKDYKNISIKVFKIIMTKIDKKILSISYKSIRNRIVYNKIKAQIIELLIIEEINKSVVKMNEINKNKIKNSEIKEN